ncbi:MAG: hypothetical protein HDR82_02665 [Bacteroides sp.]|nr:hypothetical protein [Bacteroides sp.]
MEENTQQPQVVYVVKEKPVRRGNGLGTAGFVTALIGLIICWIPILGWIIGGILSLLGLVFSFVGIFRSPRGLAIAGLIMSLISLCVIVYFIGAFDQFYHPSHFNLIGSSIE